MYKPLKQALRNATFLTLSANQNTEVRRLSNEQARFHSTGIESLNKLLGGGLLLGENVLWEIESGTFAREFLYSFMRQGIINGKQVIYFDFLYPPQALTIQLEPLTKTLPEGWEKKFLVLDCFSEASGQSEFIFSDFYDHAPSWIRKAPNSKDPDRFHHFFGRIEREFVTSGARLVFSSLSIMEQHWGRDAVKAFFGHVCPALYAFETLACWTIAKNAHPKEFTAIIEHITQVVVDLSRKEDKNFLMIKKAGGRYNPETYKQRAYSVKELQIHIC